MKFNCQLNMVISGNCVQVISIVISTIFLIGLSVYMQIFYWIFRIMTFIIKLTEFGQLPDKGLNCPYSFFLLYFKFFSSFFAIRCSLLLITPHCLKRKKNMVNLKKKFFK